MSCTNPILAYSLGTFDGKEKLKFVKHVDDNYASLCAKYGDGNVYCLPCNKCPSCLKDRAKIWAIRCALESSLYSCSSFVTLTYRQSSLPNGGLCKRDLQLFFKRLRKVHPNIRYFACGEYGSTTYRPHYHAIIFNYFPDDAEFYFKSPEGLYYYKSKELDKLWSHGLCSVSDSTFRTCQYVSKYVLKTALDNKHSVKVFVPGNKAPTFHVMSLRPAIGHDYIVKHLDEIFERDAVYLSGKPHRIGPYFNKLAKLLDPEKFASLQNIRLSNASTSVASEMLLLGLPNREMLYQYKNEIALKHFEISKKKKGV